MTVASGSHNAADGVELGEGDGDVFSGAFLAGAKGERDGGAFPGGVPGVDDQNGTQHVGEGGVAIRPWHQVQMTQESLDSISATVHATDAVATEIIGDHISLHAEIVRIRRLCIAPGDVYRSDVNAHSRTAVVEADGAADGGAALQANVDGS
jgi:hypothetical protein